MDYPKITLLPLDRFRNYSVDKSKQIMNNEVNQIV